MEATVPCVGDLALDPDGPAPFLGISGRRILEGLAAGASTGVLLTGITFGGAAFLFTPGPAAIGSGLFVFALTACGAIVPWFVGVFVFGPPVWLLGHRLGWTSAWAFAFAGAITPFALIAGMLGIALIVDPSDPFGVVLSNVAFAAFISVVGAVVGVVARRVAYRP